MDALMLFNYDHPEFPAPELESIVHRARLAQGVVVRISAPVPTANADAGGTSAAAVSPAVGASDAGTVGALSANPESEEDLVLVSATADVFESFDDLALGLGDLRVDRLLIAGVDLDHSVRESALAAVTLNFDVIVLDDALVDTAGMPVTWVDSLAGEGVQFSHAASTWLRM